MWTNWPQHEELPKPNAERRISRTLPHNCGISGHTAAHCPKNVNEVNDQQDNKEKEDSDTLEVSWGGINAVEGKWIKVANCKPQNEESSKPRNVTLK